jgi:hypothetical protein
MVQQIRPRYHESSASSLATADLNATRDETLPGLAIESLDRPSRKVVSTRRLEIVPNQWSIRKKDCFKASNEQALCQVP